MQFCYLWYVKNLINIKIYLYNVTTMRSFLVTCICVVKIGHNLKKILFKAINPCLYQGHIIYSIPV